MLFSKLITFLIQGFVIGSGPCIIICAPILLPYIAGTKRTWQEGLKATLVFSLTRLVVYTFMGGVVGYVGYYLFQLFQGQIWAKFLWVFAGLFIITLGGLIAFGKGIKNPVCQMLQKQTLANSTKSMLFLGLVIGLSPCLPLLAVLTEIMFLAEKFYQGFLYGFAFGIGTVISPLLLLGALAPLIPAKFIKTDKAMRVFNIICGALLVIVGLYIIFKKLF
ncbi:MAG: sulfite exporter TauE/SafE family protein [Candidatus Margulisbacteria bacterium]|nr:sulfite exporter TauE/SafE family protein [Candidatus Margulisiibacteriota bacterium]